MGFNKRLLLAIPAAAMAFGAIALAASSHRGAAIVSEAADYQRTNRSLSVNNGAVNAKFDVTDNDLDMKGWVLCLYQEQPAFDANSRKLDDSNNKHPYLDEGVKHYFFAANTTHSKEKVAMDITWAADAADQKEAWTSEESSGVENHTLKDYLDDQDWYLVIGPRHYHSGWGHDGIGAGGDKNVDDTLDYWENCDYYVGRKSALLGEYPSGEVHLDLSENLNWGAKDAKYAVYFWDANHHSAWSTFANRVEGSEGIYIASYELDFTPTNMRAVSFKSSVETPSSVDDDRYAKTDDFPFHEAGVIGVTSEDSWTSALATVDINNENHISFDHYKRNAERHSEHYISEVTLKKNDEFDIGFNGNHFKTFTTRKSLEDAFEYKEDKILVNEAGTYSLYFDTTGGAEKLYITTPTFASADEWALSFLGNGCSQTKSNWDTFGSAYKKLSSSAKALFTAVEHESDPTKILNGCVAQAVQRYDYVITLYGKDHYDDFMDRIDKLSPASVVTTLADSNGNTALVVVVTLAAVAAVATFVGFMISRKRRNHN